MIQKQQDFASSLRKHNARRFAGQVFVGIQKKVQAYKPGSVLSCESSYHLSGRRVAAPL